MNGQLSEHPLAELIQEIMVAGLSGSLRLTHERVKVAIYFEEGGIAYATSNLRTHRLSECARRWKMAALQQLASARENMPDMQLGLELVAKGDLSREEFEEVLERQAAEVLQPALLWTSGTWDFDPRVRLTVEVRSRVETRELLMECARRLPAEFIAKRFSHTEAEERLSPTSAVPNGLKLLPGEGFVLSRVDAPTALSELTAISGLPETETLQALYALILGGLLCREGCARAFTPEKLARARAVKAAPARVVPTRTTVEAPSTAPVVESLPETPAPVSEEKSQLNDVYALFARLDDAENHYQVLDLSRDAETGEIKRAYHTLAKRFHPDRFHKSTNPALYARVEDTFARISQAYETLKDGRLRTAYDRTLGASVKTQTSQSSQQTQGTRSFKADAEKQSAPTGASRSRSSSRSLEPEEIYQQGIAALQQGNHALAVSYLGDAARLVPQQSRYRAHYGRALAASAQTRHQAEKEFQAAIALDKNNASYRVMLATLYSEGGMLRRARSELEQVLSIDPRNEAARRLLDKLKGKG